MELSEHEQSVLAKMKPNSKLRFGIKGMIQIQNGDEPLEFVEMGRELIESLEKKGVVSALRDFTEAHVLQGEEYQLTKKGRQLLAEIQGNT